MKIVAVDLQAMAPLPGVTQIQGDITKVLNKSTKNQWIISWGAPIAVFANMVFVI